MRILNIILEGGNAIKTSSRIMLEEVNPTLKEIEKQILKPLGYSLNDIGLLGSTGKKSSSGDIDISINVPDIDAFYNELSSLIDYEINYMKTLHIVSVGFPIYSRNTQTDRIVQVDFMCTNNVEFTKFSYYSPYERNSNKNIPENEISDFKGLYRNKMFFAIARPVKYEVLENIDGEDAVIRKLNFDLNLGLRELVQTRKGKKGLTKTFKTETSSVITNNPRDIIDLLFGKDFNEMDVNTWEACCKTVEDNRFVNKHLINDIMEFLVKDIFITIKTQKLSEEESYDLLDRLGSCFKKYKHLWDKEVENL